MNISKDIKPVTYLKAKAADLLKQINETHRPVIITQNGDRGRCFKILKAMKTCVTQLPAEAYLAGRGRYKEGEGKISGGRFQRYWDLAEREAQMSHKYDIIWAGVAENDLKAIMNLLQ